jgi:hypothetical protein
MLNADDQMLCAMVFPWYQNFLVPDAFQNVMSKLIQGMEYIKSHPYDLLILTNRRFKDHLLKLEIVLARLSTTGMRVHLTKI